jgi:protein-L-isoaspartate(D-aspartate) O-methyltransferase
MLAGKPFQRLADDLARTCGIRDPAVLDALARVPRNLFVEEALRERAWADDALPIGFGQTISKPSTVARMTEALALTPEDRVLEVGTGSGYQAAVLGCIVPEVFTVERIAPLALRARRLLTRLGFHRVHVRTADGSLGWVEESPFQGILVAAAAQDVPSSLKRQLATGGRLVAPVAGSQGQILRRLVRVGPDEWQEEDLEACRFVPLVEGGR